MIGPGDVHRVSSWPVEEYLRGRLRFTVDGGLSYVDARDIVVGHLLAEERGRSGERYILTNDAGNLSHRDFFALVGRVTGRRAAPAAPVGRRCCGRCCAPAARCGCRCRSTTRSSPRAATGGSTTAAKARAELGFTVRPIEDTIRDTAEWLRADGYHKH